MIIIINAGDGAHEHPTQALLDSFSIFEKIGYNFIGGGDNEISLRHYKNFHKWKLDWEY